MFLTLACASEELIQNRTEVALPDTHPENVGSAWMWLALIGQCGYVLWPLWVVVG